jgi:hypothetical protein
MPEDFQFDFDKDTKVDPNKLHEECFNYARMSWKYGEAVTEAKRDKDYAHEKVKVIRSRLIRDARSDPESCGLGKSPKNDEIEAYYRTHQDHIDAKDEFIEAEYRHSILSVGANAIQFSKSTSIEGAIRLWEREYFTVEGLPAEVPESWVGWREKERAKTSQKQRDRMREKRMSRTT